MEWSRHVGPTPTEKTGPEFDHTYQHTNQSGFYMFVNMNQHAAEAGFASNAVMNSVVFNPPPPCHSNSSSPYKNTCMARLFVHQFGMNAGSFNISVVEMKEKENITTTLWWSSKNIGDKWHRVEVVLPNITSKYFMQVEARKGMRIYSDVAIDDFSMSPECFGFNIPMDHLGNYNYWDPRIGIYKKPYVDFVDKKCEILLRFGVENLIFIVCRFQFTKLQLAVFVEFTAQRLTIARSSTTTRKWPTLFGYRRRRLSKVFKCGRFPVKDITRELTCYVCKQPNFTLLSRSQNNCERSWRWTRFRRSFVFTRCNHQLSHRASQG